MYATHQDMIDRFGLREMVQLSKPGDRTAETIDQARIDGALSDATETVEGYLRGRYALPLSEPLDKAVTRATCVLARYDLAISAESTPTTQMEDARKETLRWLEQVSKGMVRLDARSAPATPQKGADGARVSDREKAFGEGFKATW